MQTILWRKSIKRVNQATVKDQLAHHLGELEATTTGQELEQKNEIGQEDANRTQPRTTWVWDRSKQTWVEISEGAIIEKPSRVNGITPAEPVAPPQPSVPPATVTSRIRWLKSSRKLFPTKDSIAHVINAVVPRSMGGEPSGSEDTVSGPVDNEATSTVTDTRGEFEESPGPITARDGEQAQNVLIRASDRLKEIKDKIDRQALAAKQEAESISPIVIAGDEKLNEAIILAAQVKAEARAKDIIASVEEKARAQVEPIIAQAKDKARALAEKIIAQTEEQAGERAEIIIATAEDKARMLAEKIIARTEVKAAERVESIIATSEDKARALAENIIAQTEEKAEARAEIIIATAEDKARMLAEKIIAQAEKKAEARAEIIIANLEETVRMQADKFASHAEKICQQGFAAAEHQVQHALKSAEEKAAEIEASEETTIKAPSARFVPRREESNQKGKTLPFEGTAELVIAPPVDVGKMQKMLNRLAKFNDIRILDLGGSAGKGVTIKLFSRNLARLPHLLDSLPEVEKISDLPKKVSKLCYSKKICPGQRSGSGPPVKRLMVTLVDRTTYFDI